MSKSPHPARSFNRSSRTVYLPLHELDACYLCGATSGLRLCSSCGECVYCSMECQKLDWKEHKNLCRETNRIDLATYWPFFAYMADLARTHSSRPLHRGMERVVLNNPVSNAALHVLPDGSTTNVVILGDRIPEEQAAGPKWWPTAPSDNIRRKLAARIIRESFILPTLLSICVALLAEMYTTTYDPTKEGGSKTTQGSGTHNATIHNNHRFRLQCQQSPIADFGICKGSIKIKPPLNTLGYLYVDPAQPSFIDHYQGQNPEDHYWIYFKTLKGEDFLFDPCMFAFNFTEVVMNGSYHLSDPSYPPLREFPGHFSQLGRSDFPLHREVQRFSVLRNRTLQEIVRRARFSESDEGVLLTVIERIAGRQMNIVERQLLTGSTVKNRHLLVMNLLRKEYLTYPSVVPRGIDYDPEEKYKRRKDDEDFMTYLKKWYPWFKEESAVWTHIYDAFRVWERPPFDVGMEQWAPTSMGGTVPHIIIN